MEGNYPSFEAQKTELKKHVNHHVDVLYDACDLGVIDNIKEHHAIKHKVIQFH